MIVGQYENAIWNGSSLFERKVGGASLSGCTSRTTYRAPHVAIVITTRVENNKVLLDALV